MAGILFYFSLVLVRVGTGVAVLPVFGGRNTPHLVKIGFALALAVFWWGSLTAPGDTAMMERITAGNWPLLLIVFGREGLLGALLGFVFGLFMVPARVAGEFVTQQMGLSVATIVGPVTDSPAGSISLVLETVSALIFLGLDLHHVCLSALHATFARYPIGGAFNLVPPAQLVNGVASAHEMGLLLAAPLGLTLFLLTVGLALMTRAAPQLNVFSIGFALQAMAGLGGLYLLAPEMFGFITSIFGRVSEQLVRIL